MIYLIGGPPRSGKTTLAKRLSSRLRIGWVSVDILESVVREHTLKKNYKKLFPKNILREKTRGSNDEMYEKFSFKKIADAYITQGKASQKAIEIFIGDCIREGHDFIVEGHQLHPRLVQKLVTLFPKDIRFVFLIKKDERLLTEGFQKNKAKSDWVLQKTKNKETLKKIAKMLSYFGERIEKEAEKRGFSVYATDKDFLKTIMSVEKKMAHSSPRIWSSQE